MSGLIPEWLADFLGRVTVLEVVLVIAAGFAIILLVTKAYPTIKALIALVDALSELPEFMKHTRDQLRDVHHEVHYNNGTSIKDSVTRIEQHLGIDPSTPPKK